MVNLLISCLINWVDAGCGTAIAWMESAWMELRTSRSFWVFLRKKKRKTVCKFTVKIRKTVCKKERLFAMNWVKL